MITCPEDFELVDAEMARVITQYRESPKLLFIIKTYLRLLEKSIQRICTLPEKFDLDTAVSDQLTIVGKQLGFGRRHCICQSAPVYGFECEGVLSDYTLAGFCDEQATWAGCGESGYGELSIEDDELYRKFLKVRVYQMTAQYDARSMEDCIRIFWGDTAVILDAKNGRVLLAPGRDLTDAEKVMLPLCARVLPVAPSIEIRFYLGSLPVLGFGDGFVGFCSEASVEFIDITDVDGAFLLNEEPRILTQMDYVTNQEGSGRWACGVDVHPYDCI